MTRRRMFRVALTFVLLLALTPAAFAGGWAVVTLDSLPQEPSAGTPLELGFTVRQHGVTPNDNVDPLLIAHNAETGKTLEVAARKEGPIGHFVVDVTFPSAGAWELEIIPAPFAGTQLGTLTVAPAVVAQEQAFPPSWGITASLLRWGGICLLLAAFGIALFSQRNSLGRPLLRTR